MLLQTAIDFYSLLLPLLLLLLWRNRETETDRHAEREKKTRLPGKGLDCWCWEFKRFLMRGILILLLTRNKTNHRLLSVLDSLRSSLRLLLHTISKLSCVCGDFENFNF